MYSLDKLSMSEISAIVGRSRQCISRWLTYWNISRRSGADSTRIILEKRTGSRSPNWQGGQYYIKTLDVWLTHAPGHHRAKANGAVPTHMLVAEKRVGRCLKPLEVVHHLDENRSNNSEINLCVMRRNDHMKLHRVLGSVGVSLINAGAISLVLANIRDEQVRAFVSAVYVDKSPCVTDFFGREA